MRDFFKESILLGFNFHSFAEWHTVFHAVPNLFIFLMLFQNLIILFWFWHFACSIKWSVTLCKLSLFFFFFF